MFLKNLSISNDFGIVRHIPFRHGINLIVDETPNSGETETGNNVGKTTVLMLVDFCLGGDSKSIFTDPENKKNQNKIVKDFLIDTNVVISLTLTDDLNNPFSREVILERNFRSRNKMIRKVNDKKVTEEEYEKALTDLLFPGHYGKKPTFRQIVSHNIRYKDLSVNQTLKTLDGFTRDDEYETLYLFLLGCNFEEGNTKQELLTQIKIEKSFKSRLERDQTKSAYETALSLLEMEISTLNEKKARLNINKDFESDLNSLNEIKYKINLVGADLGKLTIRKNLIEEAEREIKNSSSNIDTKQLRVIYDQAINNIEGIQKKFEELTAFHNKMIEEKARFIAKEIPSLVEKITKKTGEIEILRKKEGELAKKISYSDSFEALEEIISQLNEKHQKKGEYENTIKQLTEIEKSLGDLNHKLSEIDQGLFSEKFQQTVKNQLAKFNEHFASISQELYSEQYALKHDIITNRNGQRIYRFSSFNTNFSSGKKQGEISCFDIAYTHFADENKIPCMHFLLNDKKELMHDNQLLKIANLVNNQGPQFVASILRDKLPTELNKEEYIILKLSQADKLFRIENTD